jgi:hypothetical protein
MKLVIPFNFFLGSAAVRKSILSMMHLVIKTNEQKIHSLEGRL